MRIRPTSRVLVVDAEHRLLLFRYRHVDGPLAGLEFWCMPGGGLDPGESFEAAARRELFEETGLAVEDPGPQVARRAYAMLMPDGEQVFADERFFLVRTADAALSQDGWTELERQVIVEHRWWTLPELRAADHQIWPQDIADLLADLTEPTAMPASASANAPRLGCGAAILRGGRLLLVRRRRDPEAGHWGLPGGKVDWLEPVAAAVAREIAEELALAIRPERLLCVVDHIDAEAGEHWVAPVYLVEDAVGEPVVQEPEALAACGWFALDDLPAPLTRATQQALAHLS